MDLRELSQRLAELGRPISPSALSKIENSANRDEAGTGTSRKVDVDDLVVMAIALGTTPKALLAPEDGVTVTGTGAAYTAEEIEAWLSGKVELTPESLQKHWDKVLDSTMRILRKIDSGLGRVDENDAMRSVMEHNRQIYADRLALAERRLQHFQAETGSIISSMGSIEDWDE